MFVLGDVGWRTVSAALSTLSLTEGTPRRSLGGGC